MKITYSLDAGRALIVNGKAVFTFDRVVLNISPVDADILAHRIVNALNHMELIRTRKGK